MKELERLRDDCLVSVMEALRSARCRFGQDAGRGRRAASRRNHLGGALDFGLTSEQQMVVDTVRDFVERELYPHEEAVERAGRVPPELGEEIKRKVIDLGFYAPNLPTEVGGGGLDHLTFTLLERELGRASMALTVFWGRPSGILMGCNDEQRERYLFPSARGERLDALAMTEPGAGSDVRGMQCFARPDGDDWIVNGTKHFISHADVADFVIVFTASGEEDTPRGVKKLITCFLVDRGTPGFDIRPGLRFRLPPRLPQLHPRVRRLPAVFDAGSGRGAPRVRACQRVALRNPAHGRRDVRWPRAPRLRSGTCPRRRARAVRPAHRQVPGSVVQVGRHGHGDRRGGLDDPRRRLALGSRVACEPRDRVGEALRIGNALPGYGRGSADSRRHGALMSDLPVGAVLARCPGGARLGRNLGDTAPHHPAGTCCARSARRGARGWDRHRLGG